MRSTDEKRVVGTQRRYRIAALLGVFLGCGTLFCLGVLGLYIYMFGNPWDTNPFDNARFNRAVWLEDADCVTAGNRRAGMEQDLVRNWLNHNMGRQQVLDMLGKPEIEYDAEEIAEHSAIFTQHDQGAKRILVYYLGEELGYSVDRAWLNLYFDASGYFTEGRVIAPH